MPTTTRYERRQAEPLVPGAPVVDAARVNDLMPALMAVGADTALRGGEFGKDWERLRKKGRPQ
ncbi:hypothetical protein ACIA49_03575 [Kribbella sp. NPDC051587]|uniref:hypothetical protein n=1 Tax=Kribbella sp. NPDC051587 TaxID=3364119 RepID=UPI0037A12D4C